MPPAILVALPLLPIPTTATELAAADSLCLVGAVAAEASLSTGGTATSRSSQSWCQCWRMLSVSTQLQWSCQSKSGRIELSSLGWSCGPPRLPWSNRARISTLTEAPAPPPHCSSSARAGGTRHVRADATIWEGRQDERC
uniref:Secreted protein n=1 Tax=Arundo donax TaxID=35708 RepID=A0A0A9FUY1_ARUDO